MGSMLPYIPYMDPMDLDSFEVSLNHVESNGFVCFRFQVDFFL